MQIWNKRVFYYCQASVLFLYNGGGYQSLLALYLSGTPSQRTGTRPPRCLYLGNRLYIMPGKSQIYKLVLFPVKTKGPKTNTHKFWICKNEFVQFFFYKTDHCRGGHQWATYTNGASVGFAIVWDNVGLDKVGLDNVDAGSDPSQVQAQSTSVVEGLIM